MTRTNDQKTGFAGCCGGDFTAPTGGRREMLEMMEKCCGEDGSFDCSKMMEMFRDEDGSIDLSASSFVTFGPFGSPLTLSSTRPVVGQTQLQRGPQRVAFL